METSLINESNLAESGPDFEISSTSVLAVLLKTARTTVPRLESKISRPIAVEIKENVMGISTKSVVS